MPTTENILEGVDDDAEARAIAQAEADVAAGRVVPHDTVMKWLKSWGTADEVPCPKTQ